MLPFEEYAKIKNNYCIAYLGPEISYVIEIINSRKYLENKYPGLLIYVCCRDEFVEKLNFDRILPISILKSKKSQFAYVRDMRHDGEHTPAEILLKECG